jgi:basic membrane lipoprotein Med (substrate-binding protein (PBP1-ABC) superfamily)
MKNRLTKMFIVFTMVLSLIAVGLPQKKAAAATTASDVIVQVGQMGANSYTQSLNGVLYTVDQIGFMADRILWTEEQIGIMADRIVYVTEFSQDNSIKVIYMATSLWPTGTKDGGYTYKVALMPVAMLPAGW